MARHIFHKTCFCFTCDKAFHYLGINMHVASHIRRGEKCRVKYTYGNIRNLGPKNEKPEQPQKAS